MTDKLDFEKVKLSRHQQGHLDNYDAGHELTAEQAMEITLDPIATDVQPDGREVLWGYVSGKTYRAVMSAKASAGRAIGILVTGFRDRPPKQ